MIKLGSNTVYTTTTLIVSLLALDNCKRQSTPQDHSKLDLPRVNMARQLVFLCVTLLLAVMYVASAQKVTNLPGWNPEKPFDMYSGYIDLDQGKRYFYWFVYYSMSTISHPTIDLMAKYQVMPSKKATYMKQIFPIPSEVFSAL